MNEIEYLTELSEQGIRPAASNEAGWYDTYINEDGERISTWITDDILYPNAAGCGCEDYPCCGH